MIIKSTGSGRVQISAAQSVTTVGLHQARRLQRELDAAVKVAEAEDAERRSAVLEAQQRMAEALA